MKRYLVTLALALCVVAYDSEAVIIDLNTFTADPESAVDVAPDGSSATLYEDPAAFSVWFYNDFISIPTDSMYLTFDYEFFEGPGNDDDVDIYLYDVGTWDILSDANGNPLEVFLYSSSSGSVTWNLLGADFLGGTVGFEIDLNSWDFSTDSYVTISDVDIASIPEPSTILLLTTGLGGMVVYGSTRFSGKKMKKS